MPFKKLHPHLREALERNKLETPTNFQIKKIPLIKSGSCVFGIASKDSGKTTTLILTTLHKLKCTEEGNAPRAVVIVENKEKVLTLQEEFLAYTKYSSIRVYASYDELHIDVQKSEIYMGVDVLITTPKTLYKLFLSNGVSVSQLKIFSIEDADFLNKRIEYVALIKTIEAVKKCQYVVYAERTNPRLERLEEYFIENGQRVIS